MKKLIALSCIFTLFNINVYAENIIITEKVFVSTLESEPSPLQLVLILKLISMVSQTATEIF